MKLKFTKSVIDQKCVPPANKDKRQAVYWDSKESGFGLVVSRTCKTFVAQSSIRGKTIRVTIGRYGALDPENPAESFTADYARKKARLVLAHMRNGTDPRQPEEDGDWWSFTVRQVMDRNVRDMRKKNRRPRSMEAIEDEMGRHLADWLDRPIAEIRRKHCVERHEFVTEHAGPVAANRVLRQLRACWNTAAIHLEVDDQFGNPVGKKFPWNEQMGREPIPWGDLPAWAARVNAINNPVRRDLQWFVLLTGLRSADARTVRWEHIDFDAGTLHRPEPKGGERRKFTVPVSAAVLDILRRRRGENQLALGGGDDGWVFPTRDMSGRVTHVKEPKELETYEDANGVKRKRVCLPSPHVLRHTFASAASDAGVSFPVIQTLLNHVTKTSVTQHYIRPGEEALRQAADAVASFLFEKAKTQPATDRPIVRIGPFSRRESA